MITGIYCITNKINGKKYIGQSNSIMTRWDEHYRISQNPNSKNRSLIHKALEKYGVENFSFEILERCDSSKLNDLEKYYIKTFKDKGFCLYNLTDGGESNGMVGENNPNTILLDSEVYDIRERYNNKENKLDVYDLYKDKITFSGFHCIWCGQSRTNIHMEVYTEENKAFHRNNFVKEDPFKYSNFTAEDVSKIRDLKQTGVCRKEAYEQYQWINLNTFNDIWYNHTFTNIQSNLKKEETKYIRRNQDGLNNSMAKFTESQIIDIRIRRDNGEDMKTVYEDYKFVTKESFRKVWQNKTYKNIGVINEAD